MYGRTISEEIAILEKNSINIEIKNIEGFVVKRNSMTDGMMELYGRSKKIITKCIRSGLHYRFFAYPKGSKCCVFTEFPVNYRHKLPKGAASGDYVIVTIYPSPENFMASPLAFFYRDKKVGAADKSKWDEFGYFETSSSRYNLIPIVAATNKLCRNKLIKRNPPPPPPQEPNGLLLTLFG
ncbi:hypothetical protein [Flavobacterium hydrophilum]|uniref:Uncharacterized protein n=1 Tax=Flavobacterium hydrophilum TaxID=2211445 RepID=A0A2V4C544_9FLAO|nr:hypothetical protein [Flavobacterium hydrophilum]PXY45233.1 hypothetical protein DMB68_11105 [Flavobacterium hydrophilum]